jgi:hypothetical protein
MNLPLVLLLLILMVVVLLLAFRPRCVLELVHPSDYRLVRHHRGRNPFSQRFDLLVGLMNQLPIPLGEPVIQR